MDVDVGVILGYALDAAVFATLAALNSYIWGALICFQFDYCFDVDDLWRLMFNRGNFTTTDLAVGANKDVVVYDDHTGYVPMLYNKYNWSNGTDVLDWMSLHQCPLVYNDVISLHDTLSWEPRTHDTAADKLESTTTESPISSPPPTRRASYSKYLIDNLDLHFNITGLLYVISGLALVIVASFWERIYQASKQVKWSDAKYPVTASQEDPQQRIEPLEQQLKETEEQVKRLEAQNQELTSTITSQQANVRDYKAALESMRKDREAYAEEQVKRYKEGRPKKVQKAEELHEKALQALGDKHREIMEARGKRHSEALVQIEKNYGNDITAAKKALHSTKLDLGRASQERDAALKASEALKKQHQASQNASAHEVARLISERDAATDNASAIQLRYNDLTNSSRHEIDDVKRQIHEQKSSSEATVTDLKTHLDKSEAENAALRNKYDTEQGRISRLEFQLSESQDSFNKLTALNETEETKLKARVKELTSQNEQLKPASEEKEAALKRANDLKEDNKALRSAIASSAAAVERQKKETAALSEAKSVVEKKLADAKRATASLQKSGKANIESIDRLNQSNANLKKAKSDAERHLEKQSAAHAAQLAENAKAYSDLDNANSMIEAELKDKEAELAAVQADLEEAQAAFKAARAGDVVDRANNSSGPESDQSQTQAPPPPPSTSHLPEWQAVMTRLCHHDWNCSKWECKFAHHNPRNTKKQPLNLETPCPNADTCVDASCIRFHSSPSRRGRLSRPNWGSNYRF